jgi:acetyltransferase-like isoleucine patch superfamily enzyme
MPHLEMIATNRRWRHGLERMDRMTSAACVSLQAAWWGVEIGEDCSFYGLPLFRRTEGGRISIGDRCRLRSREGSNPVGPVRRCMLATMYPGASIAIGADSGLTGTAISAGESVIIGRRVLCGSNVTITDTDHHGIELRDRRGSPAILPVEIEDDVWLGLSVIVLKGVTIGRGTVVAAGSVVTRSLPAMVLAAGNPAKVVRELDDAG